LSAKTPERLQAYAQALLAFVARTRAVPVGQAEPRAGQKLQAEIRANIAMILQLDIGEIGLTQSVDEIGLEPLHRAVLRSRLQEVTGLELDAAAFYDHHNVAAMANALLDQPGVRHWLDSIAAEDSTKTELYPRQGDAVEAGISLADLAYTLQVGRDAMDERLGIVACSLDELEGKLRTFIADGGNGIGGLYRGQAGRDKTLLASFTADEDLKGALETWMRRGKFSRLLDLWVKGA